jgi:transcriptional regulator with XRE-family HTH domain
MITIEQCRAARGLLDWTQQILANKSGLSKTAINNFEKGYSDIKAESLRAIRAAFENNDVEFIGMAGVRKKSDDTKILCGKTVIEDLLNDIDHTLGIGGELLISHLNKKFTEHHSARKMNDVLLRCASVRILSLDMFTMPIGEQRQLPATIGQSGIILFLYKRKVAMVLWGHSVVLIADSREAFTAESSHFEYLWEQAAPPIVTAKTKEMGGT